MPACLVWLKKDLRVHDHAPLAIAAGFENAAALYVIEPAWLSSPEFDTQHLAFTLACLAPLRAQLAARGLPLLVRVGAVIDVLAALRREFAFTHLVSHEETGPLWSYQRDEAVARWCKSEGVQWQEFAQSGVVRRLKSRNGCRNSALRRNTALCRSRQRQPRTRRCAAFCMSAARTIRTGYPMVDACMRSLVATGWLNFRMRAMLVSFAAYHLWLHWREPGLFLAQQFLDFEPGIHWSQMQMQSGITGINTLRMYSPAKQAADHDASGMFIRRWVPEIGSAAYPPPIVEERSAMAHAKQRMYALRGTAQAREEAQAIQDKHVSRKSGLPPTKRARAKPADTKQRSLFE